MEAAKTLFFIVIGLWGAVALWHAMADTRTRAIARHNANYNEDEIRALWVNGELDKRIAWMNTDYPGDYQRFLGQMGSSVIPDDRYHDALTYLVAKYNGWPINWSSEPEHLDPLTEAEQAIVQVFKSRYPEWFEADEEQRSAPAWTPI